MASSDNTTALAENKVLILYILNQLDSGMIEDGLYKIIASINDVNYFYFKEVLTDLLDSKLVGIFTKDEEESVLRITTEGKNALSLTQDILPGLLKLKADNVFKKEHKNLIIPELVPRKRIVKYHEYEKVSQSQLVLLCSLNNLTDFERKYTIKLYSEILGGSSSSVLFSKVREDKGYCYYINSGVKAYDNILLINSGVEKKNIEPAIKLIRRCLKDINNGKVSDKLIESSRNTIISSIKASSDTPMGIINTALSRVLVGSDDMEERINNFSKITKEDIVKVSKKVSLHTILTLEDKEEEHEEN